MLQIYQKMLGAISEDENSCPSLEEIPKLKKSKQAVFRRAELLQFGLDDTGNLKNGVIVWPSEQIEHWNDI